MVKSLSIVMPCLNEANTLQLCLGNARFFTETLSIPSEIIVADNGSTDNSVAICTEFGARCIHVREKGYGAALHAGIMAAKGSHIIFADADASYDFADSKLFMDAFEEEFNVVIGNRFKGGISTHAMPLLHRYIGTPVISFLGSKAFKVSLHDFNCGMRGIEKTAYLRFNMQAKGMEYSTEFIAKAAGCNCRIAEVPVHLYPDKRGRRPHLRTWADGWSHLKIILLLSPRWFLLYPAVFFLIVGSVFGAGTLFRALKVFQVILDIHTLYFCSVFLILALTFLEFYYLVYYYGSRLGLYHPKGIVEWVSRKINFEKGLAIGLFSFFTGFFLSLAAVFKWYQADFKELNPEEVFRMIIPAGFFIIAGLQFTVFTFFITIMKNNR